MLVQSVDGFYYIDPIVFGEKSYLRFEDGMAEVVVRTRSSRYGRAEANKFGRVIRQQEMGGQFAFPPHFKGLHDGLVFEVLLKTPIPIPDSHKGAVKERIKGQTISFIEKWPWIAIQDLMELASTSVMWELAYWFMNTTEVGDVGPFLHELRKRVKKQVDFSNPTDFVILCRYPELNYDLIHIAR